ncbi:hypothetical protein THII_2299 [Thioploca ingrica]|uniref:Glycosyltransferase n=1 Tax=Thioploca ingrica TaxID=40754 RepID=A0A090BVC1_9GAMM|nr:hypothetical protein THII_2299 [Thioploca ingrica]
MKAIISSLSIVISVYNEEDNLAWLHENLVSMLTTMDYDYKIIGSDDTSFVLFEQFTQQDSKVKVQSTS